MRPLTQLGTLAAALALAGCGASSTDDPAVAVPVGSHLLRFESRTLASYPEPSEWQATYRVDLGYAGGLESGVAPLLAAVTREQSDPVAYEITRSGGELVLSIPTPPTDEPVDVPTEIRIRPDGSKQVSMKGVLASYPGEILTVDEYQASTVLSVDDQAPKVLFMTGTGALPAPPIALPWLDFEAIASEPLTDAVWQSSLSATDGKGSAVPLHWTWAEDPTTAWVGTSRRRGRVLDWLPLALGGALTLTAKGLTDASGNAGEQKSLGIDVFGLGNATKDLSFAQAPEAHWGDSEVVAGGTDGCSGPGCLRFVSDGCGQKAGGFAALLERGAARFVRIHYRLAAVAPDDVSQKPDAALQAFVAGVEIPGATAPAPRVTALAGTAFQKAAAPVAGLGWVTDSITATLNVPDGAPAKIGFWLDARRPNECGGYIVSSGPQQDLAVLVESVELAEK